MRHSLCDTKLPVGPVAKDNDMGVSGVWWWWLLLGGLAGWLASWLGISHSKRGRAADLVSAPAYPHEPAVEYIVEKIVEVPVSRMVEKLVDNPVHLERIRELEGQVALIAGLRGTITQLQSGLARVVENVVDGAAPSPAEIHAMHLQTAPLALQTAPQTLVSPRGQANAFVPTRQAGKIMDRAMDLVIDRTGAGAAGYAVHGMDDLEVIVGINSAIAVLLKAKGIRMFWELAQTPLPRLQAILDDAGTELGSVNPSTWPRQAGLAANNQWGELRMLQDVLEADV